MSEDPKKVDPKYKITPQFQFDPNILEGAYQTLVKRLNDTLDNLSKTGRFDVFLLESSIQMAFAVEFMTQMDTFTQDKVTEISVLLRNNLKKVPNPKNIIELPGILKGKGN